MMKPAARVLLRALIVAGACVPTLRNALAQQPPPWRIGGWVTYWDLDRGLRVLDETPGAVSEVFLFLAHLDERGNPVLASMKTGSKSVMRRLADARVSVWLTVVNDRVLEGGKILKDPDVVHEVLSSPKRRKHHRDRIAALARQLGVAGVDIDYENLVEEDRGVFEEFVRELAGDLKSQGRGLSVTVEPKSAGRAARGSGTDAWSAICPHVQRLQVMLYNQHGGWSAPGPVATPEWISDNVDTALRECPVERVVPVLKVLGFDWSPKGVKDVRPDQAETLRLTARATAERGSDHVPFFRYSNATGSGTVYYEDATSLVAKLDVLRARGFRQVMIWRLDAASAELLEALRRLDPAPAH
jgi:spore germination protein YaaH